MNFNKLINILIGRVILRLDLSIIVLIIIGLLFFIIHSFLLCIINSPFLPIMYGYLPTDNNQPLHLNPMIVKVTELTRLLQIPNRLILHEILMRFEGDPACPQQSNLGRRGHLIPVHVWLAFLLLLLDEELRMRVLLGHEIRIRVGLLTRVRKGIPLVGCLLYDPDALLFSEFD